MRKIVKPLLEILAGIPSIVYGFFALTSITPILQKLIPNTNIYNAASASIAIGIMTIPLVSSLSEDAMTAVPESLRHGAYALGATKIEVKGKIVVNAGSVGRPKNCNNRATYVLLEFDGRNINGLIQKVSYDFEKVAGEIEESELDSYFAEFIRNGGDIESTCNVNGNYSCN